MHVGEGSGAQAGQISRAPHSGLAQLFGRVVQQSDCVRVEKGEEGKMMRKQARERRLGRGGPAVREKYWEQV